MHSSHKNMVKMDNISSSKCSPYIPPPTPTTTPPKIDVFLPFLFLFPYSSNHSYDILGARILWKPKEARILKNLKKNYRSTSVIW